MLDFIFNTPTKVFFGKEKHRLIGEIIKSYGFDNIMLQYGKGSIKSNGLYDEIMLSLKENGISVIEMGGVQPNPTAEFVRKAAFEAKRHNAQLILAVGGGSVIDSSKATAAATLYDGDFWDFHSGKATPDKALPTACILTISAAGSEMSSSAVITNTELNMKRGFNSELNRCLFAVCNPELTYTVNKYQTACGVVDIMAHTMERYFTDCPPTDLTDRISESILKTVIEAGKVLMENPCNYEARANMMWASSLSHNGLTGCFRENALPVHQLEHALSGEFENIAHGAGLAVLFPAWGRYIYKYNIPRFAQFARRVFDVTAEEDSVAAEQGVEKMAEYFSSIGMPDSLECFDVPKEKAERLADLCTFGKQREIKSYIKLDYNKIKEIFESCY